MKNSFLNNPLYLSPTDYNADASDDFSILLNKKGELDRIAKEISIVIHHPVTIIDANRISENNIDPASIRANSDLEMFSLRYSCRLYRHYAGDKNCLTREHIYAKEFKKFLDKYDKDEKKPKPRETVLDQKIFFEQIQIFNVRGFNRYIAEYHCPVSGYRKSMIPLYFNGEVMGILFVGQSLVKESVIDGKKEDEFVRKTKMDYFNEKNLSELFNTDLGKAESVKNWILEADKIFGDYEQLLKGGNEKAVTMDFQTLEEYYSFIEKTCEHIHRVEGKLKTIYSEKRQKYFENKTRDIVVSYFYDIKARGKNYEHNKESYSNLKSVWDSLLDATEALKILFGIENTYIFGDGTAVAITDNKKKPLYTRNNETNKELYFDYKTIEIADIQNNGYYTSFYHKELYGGLDKSLNKSDHFIILFTNFVMVFFVKNFEDNEEIYESMAKEIGTRFVKINTDIDLETSKFMQEKQIMTLRMNRHENAHISARINDRLEYDFAEKGEPFIHYKPEKREMIVDDLKNSAKLLSNMAENIGVITGSITKENIMPRVRQVNVQEVLSKWQKMFKDKLMDRNLNLEIVRGYWDIWSTNIETVPSLFELLIYNIVDNAVKYAYRGTNIYLSWDKEGGHHIFKAINYGHQINPTDKIFDLYVRGETHKSKRVEGDGIGLYSVKRICELLGCDISYDCDFVSEYNLPLFYWYIEKVGKDGEIQPSVLENSFNSVDPRTKRDALNYKNNEIEEYDVTKESLRRRINDKMYKVTFTVKIPDRFEGGL